MLTLQILPKGSTIEQILELEQFYLDRHFNHPLNLNSDNCANGSGKNYPMSEAAKIRLRKERGIAIFMYDMFNSTFLFVFDSKTFAQLQLNIDHRTLNDCLNNGKLYLGRFMFAFDAITEMHSASESILPLSDVKSLLESIRIKHKITRQSSRKTFTVFNIEDPSSPLSGTYNSINEFTKAVKGDKGTIRDYVNGKKPIGSLYKNKWQIMPLEQD